MLIDNRKTAAGKTLYVPGSTFTTAQEPLNQKHLALLKEQEPELGLDYFPSEFVAFIIKIGIPVYLVSSFPLINKRKALKINRSFFMISPAELEHQLPHPVIEMLLEYDITRELRRCQERLEIPDHFFLLDG